MNTNRTSTARLLSQFINKQLENNSVPVAFPAGWVPPAEDPAGTRRDLRDRRVLTIDCDDTQDMDDAISLEREGAGYLLGVYIADVASFVKPGNLLDLTAMDRGTSIYLPGRTIPMLPPVLSADLCSLRPGADRRVMAMHIRLDAKAQVTGYRIERALIRSRVQGRYSEVNRLLEGGAPRELREKYRDFSGTLRIMRDLARTLRSQRAVSENYEDAGPKVILTGEGVDLRPAVRGEAEVMIEEFMVLANRLTAEFFESHDIPSIYRVQARKQTMAAYDTAAGLHAELGLERYMHFTSPIRRLADLKAHQMLAEFLEGTESGEIHRRYGEMMAEAAELAVKRSHRAGNIERACTKFCQSLYFRDRAQTVWQGRVEYFNSYGRPFLRLDRFGLWVLGLTDAQVRVGQRVCFTVEAREGQRLLGRNVRVLPEKSRVEFQKTADGVVQYGQGREAADEELVLPAWCRRLAAV